MPGFETWLHHFRVQPWASYLTTLFCSFLICKMEITTNLKSLLWDLNEVTYVKHSEQCLWHRKMSCNISQHFYYYCFFSKSVHIVFYIESKHGAINCGSTHSSLSLNQKNVTIPETTKYDKSQSIHLFHPNICPKARQAGTRPVEESGRVPPATSILICRGSWRPRWRPTIPHQWNKQVGAAFVHSPYTSLTGPVFQPRDPFISSFVRLYFIKDVERARVTSISPGITGYHSSLLSLWAVHKVSHPAHREGSQIKLKQSFHSLKEISSTYYRTGQA